MGSQSLLVKMTTQTVGLLWIHFQLCYVLGSQLHIEEFGITYNQSVDLDPITEDVINHVPRHERDGIVYRENTKIENYYLGVSVWKEEDDNHCYFRKLMQYERPLVLNQIAKNTEKRQEVINAADMSQVLIWAKPDGELTENERDKLTRDMKLLCAGIKIVRMKTTPMEKEAFFEKISKAGPCYSSQTSLNNVRGKREARVLEEDQIHVHCNNCANCSCCPLTSASSFSTSRHKRQTCGPRGKRSIDSLGIKQLVHLVIGHRQYGCE